jgi:outer membrane protein assembly factor BamD
MMRTLPKASLVIVTLALGLGLSALGAFGQTVPAAQTGSSQPAPPKSTSSPSSTKSNSSSKLPAKGKAVPAPAEASVEPDKVLYDRAQLDIKKGRYIEGRLAYQTLINTYPDSEYLAKAKLGVADSYFKEGGTSNITQAVQEYKDFITFFPFLDEAAYAQMQVAMAHYRMMEKPDRDRTQADNAEDEFQTFLLKYPQSPLVPKAEQDLRDVQEILADGQYRTARFYYLKMNYAAAAARLIDLTQRYPLYSQSGDALWMLSDVYERARKASKNEDDKNHWADLATECYQRIIKDYPLSPWADDARAQLKAMNLPVPASDPNAEAEMRKEQMYRKEHHQMTAVRLPLSMLKSSPDVRLAARSGQPNLNPPDDAISATEVLRPGASGPSFDLAMRPAAAAAADNAGEQGAPVEAVPVQAGASGAPGNNIGVQIIDSGQGTAATQPDAGAATSTAGADAAAAASSSANTITLQPVDGSAAPTAASANGQAAATQPASQVIGPTNPQASTDTQADAQPAAGGTIADQPQQPADKADSKTESTSKKKKGIHKVVPF